MSADHVSPTTPRVPPTGEQFAIVDGDTRAVVTEVGAGLRSMEVDGVPVLAGFAEDEECHSGRGQHLLPWPNRIRDGVYAFEGTRHQLALTEPERHNAIHGLTRFVPWRLVRHESASVTHGFRLFPQTGWSFTLDLEVTHTVAAGGSLTVDVSATNAGAQDAPYGYACHPYLTVGEETVDEVELLIPAALYLEVDPDRLLPITIREVDGTPYDCRDGSALGARQFDTAYTGLAAGRDDRWEVVLRRGSRRTSLWGDRACGWIQVFTGDALAEPLRRRSGIAVEPMTCGPDAFNPGVTHDGAISLSPGATHVLTWGITASV